MAYSDPEVWVVKFDSVGKHAVLLEKTNDKEIVKETIANIQTLAPSKWSDEKWSDEKSAKPVVVDIPKPCPFCGGVKWETSFIGSTPIWFAVTCSKCGARGPAAHVEGSGTDEDINRAVDDAIARWGKRVE